MNSLITLGFAAVLLPLSASAATPPKAQGVKIQSEAQLTREHGHRLEKVGPGVYQVVAGELAGKTIAIGEAGLAYDLSRVRAQIAKSGGRNAALDRQLLSLQSIQRHMSEGKRLTADVAPQAFDSATLYCYSGDPLASEKEFGQLTYGYATVHAEAGFTQPIGLGYYAYAYASASGYVDRPWNANGLPGVAAEASAINHQTSQSGFDAEYGAYSAYASTYVYSGPTFTHSLSADAVVYGIGQCWGYVGVSDSFMY
jgi:hypothetical protein